MYLTTTNDCENFPSNEDKINALNKCFSAWETCENKQIKDLWNSNQDFKVRIEKIIDFIIGLKEYKFSVSITHSNSIFFNIKTSNNIGITYDFYVEEIGQEKEALFSVYKNKDFIELCWDSVNNSFTRIEQIIKNLG